jgi:2-keto-4-pentenoate hydratase/2-oxohepta-3-ene-1,7-dioic acid hydratase in catechol pathway
MRIARIETENGAEFAREIDGEWQTAQDPFTGVASGLVGRRIANPRFLAPVEPRVILGMAHNGSPENRSIAPQAFMKSARTAAGPGENVLFDPAIGRVIVEGELAVVVGRNARNLTPHNAMDAVLGYTIGNDVTATDQNALDSFWTQSKNGVNFTPLGPWIETDLDPDDASIQLVVNGSTVAEESTKRLARNISEILVYVTSHVTLGPGDIVLTGCPDTLYQVHPGDSFEISIAGIGTLAGGIESA